MKNKYCFFVFLLLPFCFSCKKDTPQNIGQPPFTSDQLQWIQNGVNLNYRLVTQTKDSSGNSILEIDTIMASTQIDTPSIMVDPVESSTVASITYYSGEYDCDISNPNHFTWCSININNEYGFSVQLSCIGTEIITITSNKTDTTTLNGILYQNVYKFTNTPVGINYNITKCYFKKELGFLYFEYSDGSTATLIQ